MDLLVSLLPIALLIWLMVKKNSWSSSRALPFIALLAYLLQFFYFQASSAEIHATVLDGLLTAFTPILIIWGAIFLFRTLEHSGGMDVIRVWLNNLTSNPVAQLMIVGWAFPFLLEGASGFGTPAALAAPILVGLGFPLVPVAMLCLIMNTLSVSFGAVGTPTWFGFSELTLTAAEIQAIGYKSALVHTAAGLIIPLMALRLVVPFHVIRSNLLYIYLSVFSCTLPMLLLSFYTYEFPSILGGLIGLVFSVWLAKRGVGLAKNVESEEAEGGDKSPIKASALLKATFPLWGTVLVLIMTRIQQFGLKDFLNDPTPMITLDLGAAGVLTISPSLVIGLHDIFGTYVSWVHSLLYVPSLIPFILISLIAFWMFKMPKSAIGSVWSESLQQMKAPFVALLGALVMVKLLMMGGERSSTMIIGTHLAQWFGEYWQFGAPFLGALGSFFSGSATIANLTFGSIQDSIATTLSLDRTTILALQSVGAAMGNMVCINNIVAVCSVLAIQNQEGKILTKTAGPMLVYGLTAAVVGLLL